MCARCARTFISSSVRNAVTQVCQKRHGGQKPLCFLNHYVFVVNNTMFRGKVVCLSNSWGCLQRTFNSNAETLIPHYTAIIGFARERVDMINSLPVCRDWQESRCIVLGIKFLHRNQMNCKQQSSMIGISQGVGRIKGDGNVDQLHKL